MKKHTIVLTIILSVLATIALSQSSYADDILKIANYQEVYNCYNQGKMKDNVGNIENGKKMADMTNGNAEDEIKLPNLYGNDIADYDLSCRQLIAGYKGGLGTGTWTGLFTNVGDDGTIRDQSAAKTFLKAMGYKSDGSANTGGKCVSYGYKLEYNNYLPFVGNTGFTENVKTHQLCVTNLSGGKITSSSKLSQIKNGDGSIVDFEIKDGGRAVHPDCALWFPTTGGCTKHTLSDGGSWSSFVNEVYNDLKDHNSTIYRAIPGENSESFTYRLQFKDEEDQGESADDIKSNWVFDGGKSGAAKKAISKGGFNSADEIFFTADQKTKLHQYYIKTFYGGSVVCKEDNEQAYNDLTTDGAVDAPNITSKTCRVTITKHKGESVHGAKKTSDENKWTWHQDYTFQQLVALMTEDELLGVGTSTGPGEEGGTDGENRDPDCHTKAGTLGWILCPIIDISSNMVEQVYTGMIQPYLSIDAALFDTGQKGGQAVREVWGLFQGFANLTFVIIFLVVIFSQLTGVGIDNYGIKKILPKLIIGAVLINMSYLICQLAVDLSNILGRAIASMFQGVASGINSDLAEKTVNLYPGHASSVSGKFSGVGDDHGAGTISLVIVGIAGVFGVGAFLAAGPAIIIPVLLALISLVVGIFFLFALLALRQAIAVILVVVSPMAFAMYMLPNTKKIFDKWYQAFKGMLIAYPIASALVFGGDLVSKILLVADGSSEITSLGLLLSAAVVGVAPIFFIPSVIRKSMNAISGLGNIASRMQSTATGKLRTPAQNRLNQSRLNDYKMRRGEEREAKTSARRKEKNFHRAQRTMAKYSGTPPSKMSSSQRAAYNIARRNDMAYRKEQSELSDEYYSTMDLAGIEQSMDAALESGDLEMLVSGMNQLGAVDQGKLLAKMATMTDTDQWRTMMQDDKQRTTLMGAMRSQKGNPILQSFAKVAGSDKANYTKSMSSLRGDVEKKVQGMGVDAVTSMDKDAMEWATANGWADAFSSEQIAAGVGAGMSGKQAQNFAKLMAARSDSNRINDAATVSAEQLSGGNLAMAAALSGGFSQEQVGKIADGDLRGGGIKVDGSGAVQITDAIAGDSSRIKTQVRNINNNNELAASTNQAFASAAGIQPGPQRVHLTGIDLQ